MHQVTCLCLNVKIFTKTDVKQSKHVVLDHVPQHSFFMDYPICEVVLHIQGIQIEHNFLIERTKIDGWMVYRCFNCDTFTHAKHLVTDRTLVNSNILNEKSEIDMLLSNAHYSSLYKIIIKKPQLNNSCITVSNNIRNVMKSIQSDFDDFIKNEELELERRIQKFKADEKEKFDNMKSKSMHEKNMLLSIIVNNDLLKDRDNRESVESKENPKSTETCASCDQHNLEEVEENKHLDQSENQPAVNFVPITSPATYKLFGAINREYSPILSPLTFGVSNAIPEEDEDDDKIDGEETDDEGDAGLSLAGKNLNDASGSGTNAVLRRMDLKLPLKPEKAGTTIASQKGAGQVGKLKRDADKGSLGSLGPEDVFYFNTDSDDQRGDVSTNLTSDEDDMQTSETFKRTSALYSTSVPIRVPLSLRQNSREVEVIEGTPADAESMAASILALARSCHGDTEIFGELPRPRVKTPRIQRTTLNRSSKEPPLAI